MKVLTILASLAIGFASIVGAQAQNYPSRPITIIVPFPAGGPTDTIARIMADHMKDTLGQSVMVENVTGAGGDHRRRPRGRARRPTATRSSSAIGRATSAPARSIRCRGHRANDLEPIARLADVVADDRRHATACRPRTLKELIAWLKANPGQGIGRQRRRRQRRAHLRSLFRGEDRHASSSSCSIAAARRRCRTCCRQPDRPDVRRGLADAWRMCAAGKIKAFAVMAQDALGAAARRADHGGDRHPGMDISFWHGLWAPKGTPKDVVAKLNAAVVEGVRRSGRAEAHRRARHDHPATRPADAGGAARPATRPRSTSGGRSSSRPASRCSRSLATGCAGAVRMTKLLLAMVVLAVLAGITAARAQSFPSKQVTMIVPFPAGGGSDILARVVAERMKAIARPAGDRRERRRRRRHHRHRAGRALAGRTATPSASANGPRMSAPARCFR